MTPSPEPLSEHEFSMLLTRLCLADDGPTESVRLQAVKAAYRAQVQAVEEAVAQHLQANRTLANQLNEVQAERDALKKRVAWQI